MTTATAEALSESARDFISSGPHKLLIGAEWSDAADGPLSRALQSLDLAGH